jgi:hypothetical protein
MYKHANPAFSCFQSIALEGPNQGWMKLPEPGQPKQQLRLLLLLLFEKAATLALSALAATIAAPVAAADTAVAAAISAAMITAAETQPLQRILH